MRRCRIFIVKAIDQLRSWLWHNQSIQKLFITSPCKILSKTSKWKFFRSLMLHLAKNNLENIEQHYWNVTPIDWKAENVFENLLFLIFCDCQYMAFGVFFSWWLYLPPWTFPEFILKEVFIYLIFYIYLKRMGPNLSTNLPMFVYTFQATGFWKSTQF